VVVGGIGTLLVTALWMRMFPALLRIERLEDLVNEPADRADTERRRRAVAEE